MTTLIDSNESRHSAWLDSQAFSAACAALPLVSIDWVISNPNAEILLGLRQNAPAKDWWFTPGGRIRKNEPFSQACSRIVSNELGMEIDLSKAELMGVWDHFYPDSAFNAEVSTHYVNLPHWLALSWQEIATLDFPINDQHSGWRWLAADLAVNDALVHPYVREYARWVLARLAAAA